MKTHLANCIFQQGIFPCLIPAKKSSCFIDGANLYATSKALGFDIDYRKLLSAFQKRGYLLRAYYYTALVEDQEYSSIRPLIDWLDYNGYKVVTKPAKEFTDSPAAARSRATWTSNLPSTPWNLLIRSIIS